jgi:23S rRNA (uracil1939-C5)-methyltransferase
MTQTIDSIQNKNNSTKKRRRRRKRLPDGEFNTIIEENLSHDGRGIAKINGKTHFILNSLPNEEVEFKYLSNRSKFAEGIATKIINNPNKMRETPKCASFNICGGCSMQHIKSTDQAKLKQALVQELLTHNNAIPENILSPLTADPWGYRHKARIGVKYVAKKGGTLVGFRELNTGYIVDMHNCPVLAPEVGENIDTLREFITNLDARAEIPQIEIAVTQDQTALIFRHLQPLSDSDLDKLSKLSQDKNWLIYLQPKGPDSIKLLNIKNNNLLNNDLLNYYLPEFDLKFHFHPSDFTQVNPAINQKMLNQAIKLLEINKQDNILDLFSGIGNFTLPIAQNANSVIGIEGCEKLTEKAKFNAKSNNINNASFITANLFEPEKVIKQIKKDHPNINKICLDPPRDGAIELINNIEILNPDKILYVSCNPQTLARDAKILCDEKNYKITHAGIMDMFPHTKHIETMAVFSKK